MSESIIEQLKRLAEYQERTGTQLTLNYIALAKHLARLERVEAAAKARKAAYDAAPGTPYGVDETPELEEAERALDAALSENTDVE